MHRGAVGLILGGARVQRRLLRVAGVILPAAVRHIGQHLHPAGAEGLDIGAVMAGDLEPRHIADHRLLKPEAAVTQPGGKLAAIGRRRSA